MSFIEKIKEIFKADTQVELTEGGIGKPLLYLSLPVIITNLLQTAYNLIDTFWLGRYSTEALAAVSFAFPVIFLIISLGIGLSIAGSILVAQKEGDDNHEGAEFAASQTLTYISIFAIGIGIIGYFIAERLVTFLGAEPEVIGPATGYIEIICIGLIFTFGYSVFSSLMRGYGDTITPMFIMMLSVGINIILDPFLIFGLWIIPEMGVEGAAVATIISRGIGFIIGIAIMLTGIKGLEISFSKMIPDFSFLREMLVLGVPASFELVARSLSVNAVLLIVGMYTTPVAAAYGVVTRIYSAVYLPAIAVSRSVETMTGQNIGAGKPSRAEKVNDLAAKYSFLVLTILGIISLAFAEPIMNIFSSNPEVVDVGVEFLQILAITFGFIGIKRAYNGGLRGAKKTLAAALISISALWLIRVPVAWFGSIYIDETGIWIAFALSNLFGGLLAYIYFKKRKNIFLYKE